MCTKLYLLFLSHSHSLRFYTLILLLLCDYLQLVGWKDKTQRGEVGRETRFGRRGFVFQNKMKIVVRKLKYKKKEKEKNRQVILHLTNIHTNMHIMYVYAVVYSIWMCTYRCMYVCMYAPIYSYAVKIHLSGNEDVTSPHSCSFALALAPTLPLPRPLSLASFICRTRFWRRGFVLQFLLPDCWSQQFLFSTTTAATMQNWCITTWLLLLLVALGTSISVAQTLVSHTLIHTRTYILISYVNKHMHWHIYNFVVAFTCRCV